MTGIRRLPITPVLAVLAFLALAPFAAQAATPCTDCCQLPCVEAEIRYALEMKEWYRSQTGAGRMTYEAYEAAERAKAGELARKRAKSVGVLPACSWNVPDPRDPVAMRYWAAVGWTIKSDANGNIDYGYGLKTNLKECTLRDDQVKKYREVTPCSGIADAAEKHEKFHVTSCKPGQNRTVAQIAQDEVKAYDVELTELDNLKKALEQACSKRSCETKHEGGDVKKRLEEELETLKQQLARRGGRK
ncbi:MAG: hypothetical protein IPL89_15880 [Acidobacteria bacterium]|nr:hypothetical protein [Acidobacteriota bacterium]MBK9963803.1 hypothetical protein [Holophagales bacterium]